MCCDTAATTAKRAIGNWRRGKNKRRKKKVELFFCRTTP
jgi:hypothetical protein